MPKLPTSITLSAEERTTLRAWQRAGSTEHRMVERADMILRAAQGQRTDEIATALRTRPARVSKWRTRFARQRLRGLTDVPRAGAPRATLALPTDGFWPAWTSRRPGATPRGRARCSRCLGRREPASGVAGPQAPRDLPVAAPELVHQYGSGICAQAADVVGLYLNPRSTPSCSRSTRSRTFRRSSARKAGCVCRQGRR